MTSINPFLTAKNKPQSVLWQDVLEKKQYKLELIKPLKAQTKYFNIKHNKDIYVEICAEIIEDQDIEGSKVLKGQLIKIGFPIKSTENALSRIDYLIVKNITDDDNLKVTLIKQSPRFLSFKDPEIMQPTKSQVEFAEKIYAQQIEDNIKKEQYINKIKTNPVIVRSEEIL